VAIVVAGTAACLPEGPPPAGVQIVADRHASLAALVPPNGDGLLRVLILRPGATTDSADLSVISLDAANNASPELPLISYIDPVYGVGCRNYGLPPCSVDSTGAVQVRKIDDGSWAMVNAITGEIKASGTAFSGPTGSVGFPPFNSASGDRSFKADSSTTGTLVDADGHETTIQLGIPVYRFGPPAAAFLGEDFFYVDPQQELVDLPPSDVPQKLATGVTQFSGVETPDGPVLMLSKVISDPKPVTQASVLDPSSGMETVLPFDGSDAQLSPDGRWVLDTEGESDGRFTFFDYRTGTEQTVEIDGRGGYPVWLPGTAQAWMTAFSGMDMYAVWIVQPGAPAVSLPGVYMLNVDLGKGSNQPFTDDGQYWFYTTTPLESATQVVQVARTDDPTGPAFVLNPPSTFLDRVVQLPDGRLLTTAYPKQQDRSDVTVVDPRTGEANVVARRGLLVTSGQTRMMGLFHIGEGRGDLTTIDLDTAQATVLAPEFTVTASAEPQGADALAPGTRIVYQFQARTASPYDGIWVATAP
jgi:hypothetical protein